MVRTWDNGGTGLMVGTGIMVGTRCNDRAMDNGRDQWWTGKMVGDRDNGRDIDNGRR